MRVSGRKLRLAVGMGFMAALMLTLGVTSVGATAPTGPTAGYVSIVIGTNTSSPVNIDPSRTNTTYRDAVRIVNVGLNGPSYDGCAFRETSRQINNAGLPAVNPSKDISAAASIGGCGLTNIIVQPAAYPLWEVQTGFGTNVLVVPPTGDPGNRTLPAKSYLIETFR